jgi:hypothetical protein
MTNTAAAMIEAASQWWKAVTTHDGAAPFSDPAASTRLYDVMRSALWSEYRSGKPVTILVVDYEPLRPLDTLARLSGVHPADFPRKTIMDIRWRESEVVVSVGFNQPFIQIFPNLQKTPHNGHHSIHLPNGLKPTAQK